jgi:hypothetical protein
MVISMGNANALIEAVFVEGDAGFWPQLNELPITVAPGDTHFIPIEFTPLDTLLYTATLHIFTNADSGTVVLSGKGLKRFWDINWQISTDVNWLGTDGENRALAYNSKTKHIIVPSRVSDPDELVILDAATGDRVDAINCADLVGGDFTINQVECTSDGVMYVSNMTENARATPFRLYRFADENSEPTIAYSGELNGVGRYGDSMGLTGKKLRTTIYVSGSNNENIAVLTTTDGINFLYTGNIPVDANSAQFGISLLEAEGMMFINGVGNPTQLINNDGSLVGELPESMHALSSADVHYFEVAVPNQSAEKFLAITNGRDPSARLIALGADFPNNWPEDISLIGPSTPKLGNNPNEDGAGKVVYDPYNNALIVLAANNGLASISLINVIAEWDTTVVKVNHQSGVTIPKDYVLEQNYPNPFNPTTRIRFGLPKAGFVRLRLYDILGRIVSTLVEEQKDAGHYSVDFDAYDLSTGVYLYRLEVNQITLQRKMILVK